MSARGRVSVLVRTRDVERHLIRLLGDLSSQTEQPSELIIVDNFSSETKLDEMMKLLSAAKREVFDNRMRMKIVPITDQEFSYAYSANVGIFVAEGDLVCITNGHCLPLSEAWLESGVAHFSSGDIAAVGGYTLPDKSGTAWERLAYDWGWRRLNELSGFYAKDAFFSTVNGILRKSLWQEYPFDESMPEKIHGSGKFGGEDYDWMLEMLARGRRVIVEPKFDVYHSHGESLSQLFPKYLAWRRIRRAIRSLPRPRKPHTRLRKAKPLHYDL